MTADEKKKSVRVPEGLWVKCDGCGDIIYKKDMERNLHVCLKCNHHHRIGAHKRLHLTFDGGSYVEMDKPLESVDFLNFKDSIRYRSRLRQSKRSTSLNDAIVCGKGEILGVDVCAAAMDFSFMGGSMGSVVGEKIVRLFDAAIAEKKPVVIFSASGGARMQEGIISLMQMAKTASVIAKYRQISAPFISVLTDPTMGGVSASFAMLGDIIIAEPGAMIGFAGPRVIKQTIRQSLPDDFQRSEYLLSHGLIDLIVERKSMRDNISRIIKLLIMSYSE